MFGEFSRVGAFFIEILFLKTAERLDCSFVADSFSVLRYVGHQAVGIFSFSVFGDKGQSVKPRVSRHPRP